MAAAFSVLGHPYKRSIMVRLQQIMYFYYFIDPVARHFCLPCHDRVSDKTIQ